MKDAYYVFGILYYFGLPDEYGDTEHSVKCENLKEAKKIVKNVMKETGIIQGLTISDHTQKYGYKRIF